MIRTIIWKCKNNPEVVGYVVIIIHNSNIEIWYKCHRNYQWTIYEKTIDEITEKEYYYRNS